MEYLYSAKNIARLSRRMGIIGYEKLNEEYYKVKGRNVPIHSSRDFSCPLLAVGATVLSNSKIVLLQCVHFLLSHLDPTKAHLTYLDTESSYFTCHDPVLENNVMPRLKDSFLQHKDKYLDSTSMLGKNKYIYIKQISINLIFYV